MNSMTTMMNLPFDGAAELLRVRCGTEEKDRSNNSFKPTPLRGAA